MKQNKTISSPKKGMNRDVHSSALEPMEYSFALNSNTEGETGEQYNQINEPSNNLTVDFPTGFKVIGKKKDLLANRTYFFLTNPTTNFSSIGYVDDTQNTSNNFDEYVPCENCNNSYNELGTPLEEVTQTPTHTYVEIINDSCNRDLNFNINFPIKFIELKDEKLGKSLYWTDFNNPPRKINLSDIEYYQYIGEIVCGVDNTTPTCIDVSKLLMQPNYSIPTVDPELVQTGGNLKMGTYEFLVAYSDQEGNEISEYFGITNPISIFDENNKTLSQPELDVQTNFAIKLKVNNLDKNFSFYKVVVIEHTNLAQGQSYFVEGIHPITDDTILYASSSTPSQSNIVGSIVTPRIRTSLENILSVKSRFEKVKGLVSSNNYLFLWGLIPKKQLNLQPVVNLLGSFVKWQTSIAKESLYKSAIATSKYKGYMRDEVQPFGIRFLQKDGGKTTLFPLVARPAETTDLVEVSVEDINRLSIEASAPNCTETERTKTWQFFNTATVEGICEGLPEGDVVVDDITKTCVISNVETIPAPGSPITLPVDDTYIDLETYIEENYDEIIDPLSDKYIAEIAPYLIDTYPASTCTPNFADTCNTPVLDSSEVVVAKVLGEVTTKIEKDEADYTRTLYPQYCQPYVRRTDGTVGFQRDTDFETEFMPCGEQVYFRDSNFTNEDCAYAPAVINSTDPLNPAQPYFHNYYGDTVLADLTLTPTVSCTDANYQGNLHKGALWFKFNKQGRDRVVLEITRNSVCTGDNDDISAVNKLRYSIFEDCSDVASSVCGIIDTTQGIIVEIDTTAYSGEAIYVAIDAPIVSESVQVEPCGFGGTPTFVTKYRTAPPCGCFGVVTRDVEYKEVEVTYTGIILDKRQTYTASCEFTLPEISDCEPSPYQYGKFSYWESTENYPDNEELYNSSTLVISEEDLVTLSAEEKTLFEEYFVETTTEGEYELKTATDLRCKPIRHYKFPSNQIAPFMGEFNLQPFSESVIFPLGISLDSNVVETFLNIATNNNLISDKQREEIVGYEILKADNVINKSIISKAVASDMYKYTEKGKDVYYPNYPLNDLGDDLLNKNGASLIQHPFSGEMNDKFSLLAPEFLWSRPSLPTEMWIDGYQLGSSRGYFSQVDGHSKWVVLSQGAKNVATILGTAEAALEIAIKLMDFIGQSGSTNIWFVGGFTNGTNAGGLGLSTATAIAYAATLTITGFFRAGEYRLQWLRTIRDLGTPTNHASYYVTEGFNNKFLKNEDDANLLRGLPVRKYTKSGRFTINDEISGEQIKLNNFGREQSVFISLGDYPLEYTPDYYLYDNNTLDDSSGSRTIASQNDCSKEEIVRNSGFPYVTLKNYVPNQFGTIDSLKWLTTGYSAKLSDNTSCDVIYGGTVFISRDWQHKKLPLFRDTAINLADKLPFSYSLSPNIGNPRFYVDYETGGSTSFVSTLFPDIDSDVSFDCRSTNDFYYRSPSKFYLQYHGFVSYLIESEINCNYRYARKELTEQFFPEYGDMVEFTQERNRTIFTPNSYFYNSVYSRPVTQTPFLTLPNTYSKEVWDKKDDAENGVVYSLQDSSENDLVDPWLIYRPLDRYEFPKKYGKLIQLKDLESATILGRFENQMVLFNAVDNLANELSPSAVEIGTGGIFTKRPIDFKSTDLGFAGTQNYEMVSTPFGHFSVDAKRGKIFMLDQTGRDLQPISDFIGGKPSGMKNWFREHLPFKILKYIPELDIDNHYKGVGITMGWDARFDRVFITKRDYELKQGVDKSLFSISEQGDLIYDEDIVYFNNTEIFEDLSWTIAYKVTEGSWVSYYSFTPDYYTAHHDYFQTGYNFKGGKSSLWSHLLNNNSFQVFNGVLEPWIVEIPIQNQNVSKTLSSIELHLEAKRWQNQWDFSQHKGIGFNKVTIYNNTNNSGVLNLIEQKSLQDIAKYPKTNSDGSQDILFTAQDEKQRFNYFYNRVKKETNNIPIWLWDKNRINSRINPQAVSFYNKGLLERLKGDSFLVRLTQDKESRYQMILKLQTNTEIIQE